MAWVYILYSPLIDKFYVGATNDIDDRLLRHNQGRSKATKAGRPWLLKYVEQYATKALACKRETEIKKMKSREYIEMLINSSHKESESQEV